MVLLSPSKNKADVVPGLNHDSSLLHSFQFIIHRRPTIRRYIRSLSTEGARIATKLRAGRPRNRCQIPGRGEIFLHNVQKGSEAQPASYKTNAGNGFPGDKNAGARIGRLIFG
jgi:hypothetical protein